MGEVRYGYDPETKAININTAVSTAKESTAITKSYEDHVNSFL